MAAAKGDGKCHGVYCPLSSGVLGPVSLELRSVPERTGPGCQIQLHVQHAQELACLETTVWKNRPVRAFSGLSKAMGWRCRGVASSISALAHRFGPHGYERFSFLAPHSGTEISPNQQCLEGLQKGLQGQAAFCWIR